MTNKSLLGGSDNEARRSPHAAQLERGFARLVFEPPLEQDFLEAYNERLRPRMRIALLVGAGLFALFGLRDLLLMPQQVWLWTSGIRLGLIVPGILLIHHFSQRRQSERNQRWIMAGAALAVYGLLTVILISAELHHPVPYEGLMLVIFFIYFMSGLRLRAALVVTVPVVPGFLLMGLMLGQPGAEVGIRTFYLLTANAIGAVGLYLTERLAREVWLTEQLARFRAERDPLTLSFNRRALMMHLRRLWGQGRREKGTVTAVMIDVDHFKQYNDAYGHLAGDACLRQLVDALALRLRRPLDMLGRYGGEEFLVLLYGVRLVDVPQMAEQLRDVVTALSLPHKGSPLGVVSVSIGVACRLPSAEDSESKLLESADQALYRAKQGGRNRVVMAASA